MDHKMKIRVSSLYGSGYVRQALEKSDNFSSEEVDAILEVLRRGLNVVLRDVDPLEG